MCMHTRCEHNGRDPGWWPTNTATPHCVPLTGTDFFVFPRTTSNGRVVHVRLQGWPLTPGKTRFTRKIRWTRRHMSRTPTPRASGVCYLRRAPPAQVPASYHVACAAANKRSRRCLARASAIPISSSQRSSATSWLLPTRPYATSHARIVQGGLRTSIHRLLRHAFV